MATLYWDGTVAFCIITLSTHWGRVTHICISKLNMVGSDNGLLPGQQQAIIWTNTGILSIWVLGTKFSEMLVKIQMFSFKKMHLKMLSVKWRPLARPQCVKKTISADGAFISLYSGRCIMCRISICMEPWYATSSHSRLWHIDATGHHVCRCVG